MKRSTPPSARASTCSRNTSSFEEAGSSCSPSFGLARGPMDPATHAFRPAAFRASRAPWTFTARTFPSRPWWRSRVRLAPKVFVSMTSAPAAA